MGVDRESAMNLSCKEFGAFLLHKFPFGRKATEAARNMQYDERGYALNLYSATLVQSI